MDKKRKVHLICNAHIDPIWQWDWQEGASATISTFQSAANLAEEFDYIFCHNEVTVYKYIEEYAPNLFNKIKKLVRDGKWHIMGGWYLQPDCTMPSGESFVRQIKMGHKYFQEKFGVTPKVAINFDPFGHTRGLVQIVSKCGQNGYLAMRPKDWELELPNDQFIWEGYDGSRIKVNRVGEYNSPLGGSVSKIKKDLAKQPQQVISALWGVGNHGGGPSRKDLQDIKAYIKEAEEEGIEIIHSTPEAFIDEMQTSDVFRKSLYISMPGCYITMSRLKRKHIELENQLYFTEKICSIAAMKGLMKYPSHELYEVAEDLLNSEFHDVLPGTSIQSGEDNGLKLLDHGLLIAERMKTRAFFSLLNEEAPAGEGEYPIFVFNPHPYEFDTEVECEFMLADQNWSDTENSKISIYDDQNNLITSQIIQETSKFNLDWRKRIIFECKLAPMSMNRYTVKVEFEPIYEKVIKQNFVYENENKYVEIDRKTGALKNYRINGKEYLHDAFVPMMFEDNADPWGMGKEQLKGLGTNPQAFELYHSEDGIFSGVPNIRVVEDGEIYVGIEVFFEKDNSKVRLKYKIYKNKPYVDVSVTAFWQEKDKLLRIAIPVNVDGKYIGQTAFGTDELFMDGRENVSHRFVAVQNDEECLAIINDSSYASMYKEHTIYLSLVRGAGYCVHPIPGRALVSDTNYVDRIDQCDHKFSFRIVVSKESELERMAMEFNQKPYALNAFPVASEFSPCIEKRIQIDNPNVALVAMKLSDDEKRYLFRLMNNQNGETNTVLHLDSNKIELRFKKYEVKTVAFENEFIECEQLDI